VSWEVLNADKDSITMLTATLLHLNTAHC